ncbi:DUF429 domain-containing protein [Arthrobacter tecti]
MRTLGVDLAADPKKTAAAVIHWEADRAELVELSIGTTDMTVVELFGSADFTGIDCPVGWPESFVPFLLAHAQGDPDGVLAHDGLDGRRTLAYRDTDRFVTAQTGLRPLSVSADRLAHPAMRCAVLQAKIGRRFGVQPLDGSGRLAEVYPAASLRCWQIAARKYKGTGAAETAARESIVNSLAATAPWFEMGKHRTSLIASDDQLDAAIASLTARAVAVGKTLPPDVAHERRAATEGWIHLPSGDPASLLC